MTKKRVSTIIKMTRMKNTSSCYSKEWSFSYKSILTGQSVLSRKSIGWRATRSNLMLLLIVRFRNLSSGGIDLIMFIIENNVRPGKPDTFTKYFPFFVFLSKF